LTKAPRHENAGQPIFLRSHTYTITHLRQYIFNDSTDATPAGSIAAVDRRRYFYNGGVAAKAERITRGFT
jgi:hypothetical protein